jgi:hypothetical protein
LPRACRHQLCDIVGEFGVNPGNAVSVFHRLRECANLHLAPQLHAAKADAVEWPQLFITDQSSRQQPIRFTFAFAANRFALFVCALHSACEHTTLISVWEQRSVAFWLVWEGTPNHHAANASHSRRTAFSTLPIVIDIALSISRTKSVKLFLFFERVGCLPVKRKYASAR